MTISDHSLFGANYVLPSVHAPTITLLVKLASREFIELPLTDKELGKRFAEDMGT